MNKSKRIKKDVIEKSILKKIGRKGVEFYQKNGELPAFKLTAQEMESLKGGIGASKKIEAMVLKFIKKESF